MHTMLVRRTILTRIAFGVSTLSLAAGLGLSTAQAEGLKIGFSQVTLQSPFYVQLRNGAEAAAKAGGDTLIFLDANGDVSKQNNNIQDLITQGVNALIINPVNPDAVVPSLEAAKAAGIPVITVDRSINGEGVTAHIGRDNKAMGKLVGEAVVKKLADAGVQGAKIIEIQGDAGGAVMMDRRDGFHAAIEGSGHTIVEGPYAEYIRSNAVTAMQDLLQANTDVKVVYAHNDDMALGALQVLTENNRSDVLVSGVDGLSEALQLMESGGNYVATALNDPQYLGDVTIQVARHHGCEVYVFSRGGEHRALAHALGATWVGDGFERPPRPLDGAVLFAPAGELVPPALEALDRGGTLAVAGIHLSDVPRLDYARHLFEERTLTSVTANTRADGRALLELAAEIPIRTHTVPYPLERANEALLDLRDDRIRGAAVLDLRGR